MASASLLPPQDRAMGAPSSPSSLLEVNRLRLSFVVERLRVILSSGVPQPADLLKHCISIARGIDFALSKNDVPQIVLDLPPLIKQVYQHRNEESLQLAVTILMIFVKNACRSKWFCTGVSDELLKMANELLGSFCTGISITTETSDAQNSILKIIPRFYPKWKLGRVLVSFEAKPGYGVLISDFPIEKFTSSEETVNLFAAKTDDLETSSCLILPPEISFLVNGKGVKGRTNVYKDKGPQFPADITRMLKYGTNIIQIVGDFPGSYIIAVVFMGKAADYPAVKLAEYVQPVITTLEPGDPEITEGPSKISLNCPISFRRIRMPVKGHLCRHRQCFDYDNYLEINSRNPSWHCPICSQPASFIDLRIDQCMVKILQNVTVDATNVVIFADGNWEVVFDTDGAIGHRPNGTFVKVLNKDIVGESTNILDTLGNAVEITRDEYSKVKSKANAVDLTMDEDVQCHITAYEAEDCKPLKDLHTLPISESLPIQPLPYTGRTQGISSSLVGDVRLYNSLSSSAPLGASACTLVLDNNRIDTLESLVPTSVLNPVAMDAISPAPGQEGTTNVLKPYLNNDSNINRVSHVLSHQTIPHETLIVDADIDMPQVSSDLDVVTPLEQHYSQKQDIGCQSSVSSGFQQVAGLPTSSQVETILPSVLQNMGAYKDQLQSLSDQHIPLHQFVNPRGAQTLSQCTTSTQSFCSPSQNTAGTPRVNCINPVDYRQASAAHRAAQAVRLPSGHPPASTSGPFRPMMANNSSQNMVYERLQHTVGGPRLTSDLNWRRATRMRGSLIGQEYTAALNRYQIPPSQALPSRPLGPSVTHMHGSQSGPMSAPLLPNPSSTYMHGSQSGPMSAPFLPNPSSTYMPSSQSQQANWRHGSSGN